MGDLFTDAEERTALVHDAAGKLGLASWVVEKDLWVCWLLARLNRIDGLPKLTFKGGTSLSKVHRLIERFSEDIDLTFSREGWGFDGARDPLRADLGENERKRLLQAIADRAAATVRDQVVPSLLAACQSLDAGWSVTIDPADDQAVLFAFPSPVVGYTYNKPVVKAEFGARGDPWPTAPSPVRPYLDEVHPGLAASAAVEVTTLAPERTFWEKATLLHALHHGSLVSPAKSVDRTSRHLYDVHRMWSRPELRARLLADPALLTAVVRNKRVFFKDVKARYQLVEQGTLNAAPHAELEPRLRADYRAMAAMLFPGSPVPAFDDLLVSLAEVDAAVARWATK